MGRILTVVLAGMLLVGCTSRIAGPTAPTPVVGADGTSFNAPGDGSGDPGFTRPGGPTNHEPRPASVDPR